MYEEELINFTADEDQYSCIQIYIVCIAYIKYYMCMFGLGIEYHTSIIDWVNDTTRPQHVVKISWFFLSSFNV